MSNSTLEKRLVGAWELVSYEAVPVGGGDTRYPMGPDPTGLIVYSDSGHMSVNFQTADRMPYVMEDPQGGTDAERAAAAKGFVGYSGTYNVTDEGIVEHHVNVSLMPNFIGSVLTRWINLHNDLLALSLVEPLKTAEGDLDAVLTWRRV